MGASRCAVEQRHRCRVLSPALPNRRRSLILARNLRVTMEVDRWRSLFAASNDGHGRVDARYSWELLRPIFCALAGCGLWGLTVYLVLDYGGVLAWSQWLAVCAMLVIGLIAIPLGIAAGLGWELEGFARGALAIPLLCLVAWGIAWFQTMPVPAVWSQWLSPGSAKAYERWIPDPVRAEMVEEPGLVGTIARGNHPLSVSQDLTRMAMTTPALFAVGCLVSLLVFRSRVAIVWLLVGVASAGAALSFLGISDKIRAPVGGEVDSLITARVALGAPFGPFVCRNNAAGYLNLTLAASIGLLAYSILRHSGRDELPDELPDADDRRPDAGRGALWAVLQRIDPLTLFSLVLAGLSLAGVLASQSRGGALAALVGAIAASLFAGGRWTKFWLPLLGLLVVGGVAALLGSIGMSEGIGERLETLRSGRDASLERLEHWSDALGAAGQYLPLGAGFGAYRYAYLPYQRLSAGGWFVNADNLFVEWWVEGGLWLLTMVFVGVAFFVSRLRHLSEVQGAPHVRALVPMGWFLIGSQLTSQFFDFGMLMPSLYLTLAALVGATMGVFTRDEHSDVLPGLMTMGVWSTKSSSWGPLTLGAVGAGALLMAQATMRQAAMDRYRTGELERIRAEAKPIDPATLPLDEWSADSSNPALLTALARTALVAESLLGQDGVDRQNAGNEQAVQGQATISARRAVHYLDSAARGLAPENSLLPGQSPARILRARRLAMRALMLCPLHDVTRYQLLETGFLDGQAVETTQVLLTQWAQLRSRNPDVLQVVARVAVVHPGGELARSIVRQVLELEPGRDVRFMPMLELLGGTETLPELLPDDPGLILRTVETLRVEGPLRQQLLERTEKLLAERLRKLEGTERGAEFAIVAGNLEAVKGNLELQEQWLRKAVDWKPLEPEYRYELGRFLQRKGDGKSALQLYESCIRLKPQESAYKASFEQLKKQLTEELRR